MPSATIHGRDGARPSDAAPRRLEWLFYEESNFFIDYRSGREQAARSLQPHTRSCRAHNRVASAGIFQERLHLGVTLNEISSSSLGTG